MVGLTCERIVLFKPLLSAGESLFLLFVNRRQLYHFASVPESDWPPRLLSKSFKRPVQGIEDLFKGVGSDVLRSAKEWFDSNCLSSVSLLAEMPESVLSSFFSEICVSGKAVEGVLRSRIGSSVA